MDRSMGLSRQSICLSIFIAREQFFALNRISVPWSLQRAVLKHFWLLAQNHCQNALFSLRASHFSLWTEYLVFGDSRKPFWRISGSWPKTIARTYYFHCARAIFRFGPNIWFLDPPEGRFKGFLVPGAKPLPERLIFIAREQFFDLDRISGFWRDHVAVLEASWCGFWASWSRRGAVLESSWNSS